MTESAAASEPRVISDVVELVQLLELVGVQWFEVQGRLAEDEEGRPDEATFNMQVRQRMENDQFEVRFRMVVADPAADYLLDVGTLFRAEEPIEIEQEAVADFIEKVAVMVAYPYLREALSTIASRLQVAVPVLGLLKAGQFALDRIPDVPADVVWPSADMAVEKRQSEHGAD